MCGIEKVSSIRSISGSWLLNSVGVLLRFALYSGYSASRNVFRERSNATATWVGCSSRSTLTSIDVNP